MPITSRMQRVTEDGVEKDAFVVTFTNGALKQLEELRAHHEESTLDEVVKLGISVLQGLREMHEKDEAAKAKHADPAS